MVKMKVYYDNAEYYSLQCSYGKTVELFNTMNYNDRNKTCENCEHKLDPYCCFGPPLKYSRQDKEFFTVLLLIEETEV